MDDKVRAYAIGIDLGTTHCALSYFNLKENKPRGRAQPILPVPQLTHPATVEERLLLPSFLYLPNPHEFPPKALALPWDKEPRDFVGELARAHGSRVPTRLVASAKSWLCHGGIDRKSPLLPWQSPADVQKISPLDATAKYLAHLRQAWDYKFGAGQGKAELTLVNQDVIVTVPASFDPAARELTLEAAQKAGFPSVTLIEEPQAALYAWLEAAGESFRKRIGVGEVILVVDVGGGTTDFSLIAVGEQNGDLDLQRLAVGDHILLGGDNMDLTLAHALSQRLAAEGRKLDSVQLAELTYSCRQAKEQLFASPKLSKVPISIASRGSSLVGGTIATELRRAEVDELLTNGFFPQVEATDAPQTARRTGLAQMALPYAQDPGITRHLAAFLSRQARALQNSPSATAALKGATFIQPTALLFNGGVFKAEPLKKRLLEVVNSWLAKAGAQPVNELEGADLDLAVARGAAYYGWVRHGHGLRIRGGTARSYYVGVESPMPAVPGMEPPVRALCLAPFGMEEGTKADIPPMEFGLVVGEPTRFRFFSSSVRREDPVGKFIEDADGSEELEELPPIQTTLPSQPGKEDRLVPVNLQAAVTELGSLELRCLEKDGPGRWKLELSVRMKE